MAVGDSCDPCGERARRTGKSRPDGAAGQVACIAPGGAWTPRGRGAAVTAAAVAAMAAIPRGGGLGQRVLADGAQGRVRREPAGCVCVCVCVRVCKCV